MSNNYRLTRRNLSTIALVLIKIVLCFLMGVAITMFCIENHSTRKPTETPAIANPAPNATGSQQSNFTTAPRVPPHNPPTALDCYKTDHIDAERIQLFEDVLAHNRTPTNSSNNIFFHVTTCLNGAAQLNVRQACAVESAARANPNTDVFLLYASPVGFENGQPRPVVFEALAAYPNVHWRNLNLWTYTRDTPAADWMRSGDLFRSPYLSEHIADLLRLVSLYKWGGLHMDLDFVVRMEIDRPPTYAAKEMDDSIGVGVINLENRGIGRLIAKLLLGEFVQNFNLQSSTANGPELLQRVLNDLCKVDDLADCQLITVAKKTDFYAIEGTMWQRLFDRDHAAESMALFNGSIAVHMWSELSRKALVTIGEGSAYEMLAREFCPKVFATIRGKRF